MNDYEVWSVNIDFATRECTFFVDCHEQAMKSFIRNKLNSVFYYDNWKKENNVYMFGGKTYIVVYTHLTRDQKLRLFDIAYDKYFKIKLNRHVCDCGSEKVYGKSGAHSFWCSTRG